MALGGAPSPAMAAIDLQAMIDAAEDGAVLALEAATYAGPIVIDKPITIDGGGHAVIDAGGKGTVVTIKADGANIYGLRLTNSGHSHDDIDAGLRIVEGKYNVVRDNIIENCLFGIDIQQGNNNIVKRNHISSKDETLGLRGDAIRLWYSFDNKVTENEIRNSRDFVVWYSANNLLADNHVENGRYGIHFMYSKYNLIEGNSFRNNSVGIFLMYSDDVVVRKNFVYHAHGAAGMGIGMKETSNTDVTDNEILYSGTGLYLDVSPFQPETTNRIYRNTVAYSRIGVLFLNDWKNNIFKDNKFIDNIRQVSVNEFAGATRHIWEGNYWDDYEGFDQDGDGIGDKPYAPKVYADRVWMDTPSAAFFLGTPLLSLVDFMERLAPFTEPLLMLTDARPRFESEFEPATHLEQKMESQGDEAGTLRIDPFGLDNPKVGHAD
ncbi:MAG: nitrous oxide reductase family maturation protein NosD [Alphaproteobacteria bacterium]|nr:nitrous oxide reductase family maturation protein NosD [Alphaproteobacteria bacterium]